MGKRGARRAKAAVKDLSSGIGRAGNVAQKVRVTDIKDGTSNTR